MRPTSGRAASLALILTAVFMVVLDFSIVNVALAAIERELHASPSAVQWVITAYAVTFGGLLVLGGRVADLFGRRRVFVAGLLLFSLASLAGGLAGNVGLLVAARALQGAGAALVAPAALSLVTTTTEAGPARTRALGLYGATASIGFVAGLVLGGVLVQAFDWRAVLWVNVPLGLAAAALAPALVPAPPAAAQRGRLDLAGAALVTLGVAAIVYGVSQGPASGWLGVHALGGLALGAGLLAAFVAVERRHPRPLVRLALLRRPSVRDANLVTGLMGAWSATELLVVPLFLQLALHWSALAVGFAMAPQGVVGFAGASLGPRLVRRIGVWRVLVLAAGAAAVGLAVIALSLATRSYLPLLAGFLVTGFGTATGAFASTVVATDGISGEEQGLASGLVNMTRQVGAAVGVAVAAALIGSGAAAGGAVAPDRTALLVAAGAAVAAGSLLAVRLTRSRRASALAAGAPLEVRPRGPRAVAPASLPERRLARRPLPVAAAAGSPLVRRLARSSDPQPSVLARGYRAALCRVHQRRRRSAAPPAWTVVQGPAGSHVPVRVPPF